jgi:hypothetical protein
MLVFVFLTAAGTIVGPNQAHAQKLEARYSVSMTGIPVGKSTWTVNIGTDAYSISASGGAAGILSILMTAEGVAETAGKIQNDRLVPMIFTSSATENGDKIDLRIRLDNGVATTVEVNEPPPEPDRVPITDGHRRGVVDPLTALLIHNVGVRGVLAPDACNRTLAIFDGRRRYDLLMSFKRIDHLAKKEYEGEVLVCNVILRPIAGHRANSAIMKYVVGRRDMEIEFAPIKGTPFLILFRLSAPTLLGTMVIQATQFESSAPIAPVSR